MAVKCAFGTGEGRVKDVGRIAQFRKRKTQKRDFIIKKGRVTNA